MKWLQDNFLGMALLVVMGIFLLTSISLVIVWALPVSTEIALEASEDIDLDGPDLMATEIGSQESYTVINDKPVFNQSRLPVMEDIVDGEGVEDVEIAIKDAPEFKLTGVIIMPGARIASLQPAEGGEKSVMAKEGEALIGDYVGWHVSSVQARKVVLESRDGQTLELELQVHDVKIAEPPKPIVVAESTPDTSAEAGDLAAEQGEPLTRAEQIRQRIAERREELRREQEGEQSQSQSQEGSNDQAAKAVDYQSAIRAMMNKKPKEDSSKDNNDD
jgi:hypothetical protein